MRLRLTPEDRRRRILDAALELFAERGYERASMAELGQRAGIVASVLYDHFPSKRDLYVELLGRLGDELIGATRAAAGDGTPRGLFRAQLEAFYAYIDDHPSAWRMLFRDPPADAVIAAAHRRVHERARVAVSELVGAIR